MPLHVGAKIELLRKLENASSSHIRQYFASGTVAVRSLRASVMNNEQRSIGMQQ